MSHIQDGEVQTKLCTWINELLSTNFSEVDLGEQLKDGVILCKLMNIIEPRSIPRINTNTTDEYKIKENISFFKQAAEEYGVPKTSIFSYSDLMEGNIKPTIECLLEILNLYEKKIQQSYIKSKTKKNRDTSLPEFQGKLDTVLISDFSSEGIFTQLFEILVGKIKQREEQIGRAHV